MGFVTTPIVDWQTYREGLDAFDIGAQCIQWSATRLVLHLAKFFPSTVGRSLEFVTVKTFGKELGNDDHNSKWTAR